MLRMVVICFTGIQLAHDYLFGRNLFVSSLVFLLSHPQCIPLHSDGGEFACMCWSVVAPLCRRLPFVDRSRSGDVVATSCADVRHRTYRCRSHEPCWRWIKHILSVQIYTCAVLCMFVSFGVFLASTRFESDPGFRIAIMIYVILVLVPGHIHLWETWE